MPKAYFTVKISPKAKRKKVEITLKKLNKKK
jgi:hypothetical protein